MATELPPFKDTLIRTNGVNLRVRTVGPLASPAVLLLHGFPEFWLAWREQVQPLLDAGWRVILPDQRGYATSSKPEPVTSYTRDKLADDLAGLLDELKIPQAAVVGHSWGGTVGMTLAQRHAGRVSAFVGISSPHPTVGGGYLGSAPLGAPWGTFSQLPPRLVPDWMLTIARIRALSATLSQAGNTIPPHDMMELREEWAREGGFDAIMGWFRAFGKTPKLPTDDQPIGHATLIWGDKDAITPISWAEATASKIDARVVRIAGAGHFAHHDHPAEVTAAILEAIGRHDMIVERARPRRW